MAELGVNVAGRGEYAPAELAAAGARWARCVAYPEVDLRDWLADCVLVGVRTLLVLPMESLTDDEGQWAGRAREFWERYAGLVTAWQVGNEPDAAPESVASWTMDQARLNRLLAAVRAAMPTALLVSPGFSSGQPGWILEGGGVDLSMVDALAYHPYGKHPTRRDWGTGPWPDLHEGYRRFARPLWVTEFGMETLPEAEQAEYYEAMLDAFRAEGTLEVGLVFCWDDAMVAGFGLCDHGRRKASYWSFVAAATGQGPRPGGPVPVEGGSEMAEFRFGFKAKAEELGEAVVGRPLEDEEYIHSDYSVQFTDRGLMVYSKRANTVHFLPAR